MTLDHERQNDRNLRISS